MIGVHAAASSAQPRQELLRVKTAEVTRQCMSPFAAALSALCTLKAAASSACLGQQLDGLLILNIWTYALVIMQSSC